MVGLFEFIVLVVRRWARQQAVPQCLCIVLVFQLFLWISHPLPLPFHFGYFHLALGVRAILPSVLNSN